MKYPLLSHLYKLKRTKGLIQNPVVHQQNLVPMMNLDHSAILVGVCFEESFVAILEACLLTYTFYFVDEPFMLYSIRGFRYIKKYPCHIFGEGGYNQKMRICHEQ